MADTPETPTEDGAAAAPQVRQQMLAQYVRDLSFENVMAQKGVKGEVDPEISVRVNLDVRKRNVEHQFEVINQLNIQSKNKGSDEVLFELELEYATVFHIEGVPDDQMHPFLLIECPRQMFPYVRRIVSDVTRDGGFPPLNMDQIDWVKLYQQEIIRRQAAQAAAGEQPN